MKVNLFVFQGLGLIGFGLFIGACSLENPESQNRKVQIVLEGAQSHSQGQSQSAVSDSLNPFNGLLNGIDLSSFMVGSTPTSISDFRCFAVNITGSGIVGNSEQLRNCTTPNNMRGFGVGLLSEVIPIGRNVEIDIPSGQRTISVYGVHPPPSECDPSANQTSDSGPGGGFFLGSKSVNITESQVITVPISYSGDPADVVCTGDSLELKIDGSRGKAFKHTGNCVAVSNTVPAPIFSGTEMTTSDVSSSNGVQDESFCSVTATGEVAIAQFSWNVSDLNLSPFNAIVVNWAGEAGLNTAPCASAPHSIDNQGQLSSPQSMRISVFHAATGQWQTFSQVVSTGPIGFNSFMVSPINQYLLPGGFINVRVVAGEATVGTNQCSVLRTDFVSLRFQH